MIKKNQKKADFVMVLCVAILVVIASFPENNWSFSVGIDPSLKWVFNHLFATGLEKGRHIVFPHGPLAFFMYPLPANIILVNAITAALKILLVANFFWLYQNNNKSVKWSVVVFSSFLLSLFAGFNQLLLANVIMLYCNYHHDDKIWLKLTAFLLTAFAFYIRAYVAIITGVLFVAFVIYYFLEKRKVRQLLFDGVTMLGLMLLFWLFMYKSFLGFGQYILGMLQLAQDNSSAAAFYPYNNWLVIVLFVITMLLIFLANRSKKTMFFVVLTVFSLFAAWKHGMAREDIFHAKGFLIYSGICLLIFSIFNKKRLLFNFGLSVIALTFLSLNMKNSVNYFSPKVDLKGSVYFYDFVSNFNELKEQAATKSKREIKANRLSQNLMEIIGNSTVDIYPWDYSVIPANNLSWQPRVIIQSYAAYTSWLDSKNATHFKSDKAPEYVLWEKNKITKDVNGGGLNSIDNRYLLNDEPQTILQLIQAYQFVDSDLKFQLFQKREHAISLQQNIIGESESTWGEWIIIPENKGDVLMAELHFRKTALQRVKSFLYKDEQFWIYLKLKNGVIHKYRIVPKNAEDGVWINPYLFDNRKAFEVQEIMFVCSNQEIIANDLTINWEEFNFGDKLGIVKDFFGIQDAITDSILLHSKNTYEQQTILYWNELKEEHFTADAYNGLKANCVKAESFSSTFSISLDSIPFNDLKITADCWVKSPSYKLSNQVSLIIDINSGDGKRIWHGIPIDEQLIDQKQWNNIFSSLNYTHDTKGGTLSVYVWNTCKSDILVDDFRIKIFLNQK